ncbi:TPM domain-containing protein [Frigidibacter sp. RF13]|uniref:TPM domain-containing protein n=1 Tax=Frigidibacter sp. RF13 TaxID=2997340 RepID=UPI002270E466|nr:TPM domain-containing protein [Frigidibacter sp. RF13]MCY1125610.1 TPM domain-containing protein [Frigidibacter sp. RF13]
MMSFLRILLALLSLGGAAMAATYPSSTDPYLTDEAHLVPDGDAAALRDRLRALKTETGVEVTVVTLSSQAAYDAGVTVERFAQDLFNHWGVGRPDLNDGIMLLVLSEDRIVRVQLGAGYDQGFDVTAQDIVSRWIVPELRAGRPGTAISAGVDQLIERIARRHLAELPPETLPAAERWSRHDLFSLLIGLAAAGFMIFAVFRRRIEGWALPYRRCPSCGRRGLHRDHVAPDAGTVRGFGATRCDNCDWREERRDSLGRMSDRDSSDDSFGGGRSSGGGATGRW